MLFPHEDIVKALEVNDPKKPRRFTRDGFTRAYKLLVENRPDGPDKAAALKGGHYPEVLHAFLIEDLPPLRAIKKIVFKLTVIAERHGARISDFDWWDIRPGLRALVATLTRDGYVIRIYFSWRKTNKGEVHPLSRGCHATFFADPHSAGGLHLDFDAQVYQDMRAQFESWLKVPLVLPPNLVPKNTKPSCLANSGAD